MKKLLSILAIALVIVACNNAADNNANEDSMSDPVTVDTMGTMMDTSSMRMDTSRMDSAIRK